MGVSGLTTFLDNSNYLLADFKLKNTKLVIDGNNFYHFIYYLYQVPHVYGGDYKQFAKICRSFFDSLFRCNITPYVVFDGAYDLTDIKFKSAITRAGKKMVAANSVAHGESYRVLPLLTHETFISVLNELNIKHATCNFESDIHTACLAASFNCPVLTNDSDFFVFDLPGGVILLDYLDVALRREADGSMFMKAQLFKVQKLVDHMKLPDASFVALFATVLGNGIVDKTVFESFLARFTFSKANNNKRKLGKRFAKITGLFKWLSSKKSIEGAINDVVSECAVEKREKIHELVRASMSSYSVSHTYLADVFADYEAFSKGTFTGNERVVNKFEEECPGWLQVALNRGEVQARVVNLWVSGKVILQPQIETYTQASSHLASRHIRVLINALVTNGRRGEFREYVKKDGKLSKQVVNSDLKLKVAKKLPSFENLFEKSREELMEVFLEAFPGDQSWFLTFPEKHRLLISAMLYWTISTTPLETSLMSLLLGVLVPEVMLRMVPFEVDAVEGVETQVGKHLLGIKHRKKYFNVDLVHSFNQFQSCLQSLTDLNSILRYPLSPCDLSFDSSSLLFIHHYLETNLCNMEAYVESVCSKFPRDDFVLVMEVFCKLKNHLSPRYDSKQKTSSKNSKRNKNSKRVAVVEEVESEVEEAIDDYSDVENQFSCLKLSANE